MGAAAGVTKGVAKGCDQGHGHECIDVGLQFILNFTRGKFLVFEHAQLLWNQFKENLVRNFVFLTK
jgi:hypothetical protein